MWLLCLLLLASLAPLVDANVKAMVNDKCEDGYNELLGLCVPDPCVCNGKSRNGKGLFCEEWGDQQKWCYVDQNSGCTDTEASSHAGLWWSYNVCKKKNVNECENADLNGCIQDERSRQRSTCVDTDGGYLCACTEAYGQTGHYFNIRMPNCLRAGGWGSWGSWTACSCGFGEKERYRTCNNPVPEPNGRDCQGDGIETANCQVQSCAGVWGQWGEWTSTSTVNTLRNRTRSCRVQGSCNGADSENNIDIINTCSQGTDKLDSLETTYLTQLLTELNKPNLSWNELKEALDKFELQVSMECLNHGQVKYTGKFYCKFQNKASEPICKKYLWYEQVGKMKNEVNVESNSFKNALFVTTSKDYKTLLLNQIDEDNFEAQRMTMEEIQIKISNNDRNFREDFGAYLSNVADFDYDIANEDKDYIQALVKERQDQWNNWIVEIKHMLEIALGAAYGKSIADLGTRSVQVASKVASSFNPIAWLTGAADASDIIESTTDASEAANNVAKVEYLIGQLGDIANITESIRDGAATNKEVIDAFLFLTMNKATCKCNGRAGSNNQGTSCQDTEGAGKAWCYVDEGSGCSDETQSSGSNLYWSYSVCLTEGKELSEIASDFIENYRNFTPGLKEADIQKLVAKLQGIYDYTCQILEDSHSAAGNLFTLDVMTSEGYCTGTSIGPVLAQLESALGESYEIQFELMEAGAQMAKAYIAASLARRVQTNFESTDDDAMFTENDYVKGLLLGYMSRRNNLWSACNTMEYERYGEAIKECDTLRNEPLNKDALRKLSQIANQRHHTGCDQQERLINIPATLFGSADEGVVNLGDLYGKGVATLNISTASYAKKNRWIEWNAPDTQVFVSKFMLILPPRSHNGSERVDEISIAHVGANMVNNKFYFLKSPVFTSAVKYNPLHVCIPLNPLPYLVPNCPSPYNSLPCVTREGSTTERYLPSLYGEWQITLFNNLNRTDLNLEKLALPMVNGTLYLQARVKTCVKPSAIALDQPQGASADELTELIADSLVHSSRHRRSASTCCASQGQAWDIQSSTSGQCKACPAGHVPANQGYYCRSARCYNKPDCCTNETKCDSGEGTCQSDSDCVGWLTCEARTCAWGGDAKCCTLLDTPKVLNAALQDINKLAHDIREELNDNVASLSHSGSMVWKIQMFVSKISKKLFGMFA